MNDFEPQIVAFCCHYCAYAAADLAGSLRVQYPTNVKIVRLPCTGKLDALHVLKAFEQGGVGGWHDREGQGTGAKPCARKGSQSMIVGEQKPVEEIKQLVADHDSVLV